MEILDNSNRFKDRQSSFQQIGDLEECKKRREDFTIQLRRSQRSEQTAQRRARVSTNPNQDADYTLRDLPRLIEKISLVDLEKSADILNIIAFLGADYHDSYTVSNTGIIEIVSNLLNTVRSTNLELMQSVAYLAYNLTVSAASLEDEDLVRIIDWVDKLKMFEDPKIQEDCIVTLYQISTTDEEKTQMIVDHNLVSFAVRSLKSASYDCKIHALKIVRNLLATSVDNAETLIEMNILDEFVILLNSNHQDLKKYVFCALRNLLAGEDAQITAFLDHKIVEDAIKGLVDRSYSIRIEAAKMFRCFLRNASKNQKMELIPQGIFTVLPEALNENNDPKFLVKVLDICALLLEAGREEAERVRDGSNQVAFYFDDSGSLEDLEALQYIQNDKVNELAMIIWSEYFGNMDRSDLVMPIHPPVLFEFS